MSAPAGSFGVLFPRHAHLGEGQDARRFLDRPSPGTVRRTTSVPDGPVIFISSPVAPIMRILLVFRKFRKIRCNNLCVEVLRNFRGLQVTGELEREAANLLFRGCARYLFL